MADTRNRPKPRRSNRLAARIVRDMEEITNLDLSQTDRDNPDRAAEAAGRRRAMDSKWLQGFRPKLPSVEIPVVLHIPEVATAYLTYFEACIEYAAAIDHVAGEKLRNRESYNAYLVEFDGYIEQATRVVSEVLLNFEQRSSGNKTDNPAPVKAAFRVNTRRAMQIHEQFLGADTALRYGNFMMIFGIISPQEYQNTVRRIPKAFAAMAGGLRKVKMRCFDEIASERRVGAEMEQERQASRTERLQPQGAITEPIAQRPRRTRRSRSQEEGPEVAAATQEQKHTADETPDAPSLPEVPQAEGDALAQASAALASAAMSGSDGMPA